MKQPALTRGRGLTASQLKIIAIVTMLIDHVAWAFVPDFSPLGIAMHFVGRITGPIMFYFIAEGYHYTRNKNRYTLRLGVFALLSYLPFYYFETGHLPSLASYSPVGVIYTLLLGLLALRAIHEVENKVVSVLLVLACLFASAIGDWPLMGVVLVVLFDRFRGNYKYQFMAAGALFLLGIVPSIILGLTSGDFRGVQVGVIQTGQFMPLVLLGFYNGQRGGNNSAFSKWFFYIIYPTHLLLLGVLKYAVLG